jgi:hypothetical protein
MEKTKSKLMVRFVPYNRCIECGDTMVVIETETNVIQLDRTGLPVHRENLIVETKLRCLGCGREADPEVKSMRYMEKTDVTPIKDKNPFGYED